MALHQLFINVKKAYDSVGREVLYNISRFGTPMKLVRFINTCLNEIYNRVRVSEYFSDMFPNRNGLKPGFFLSPMLFNFALEYAIGRVQVKQEGLKLNGTHQLLVYANAVNVLGGSVHTLRKNTKALVVESEET